VRWEDTSVAQYWLLEVCMVTGPAPCIQSIWKIAPLTPPSTNRE
jgi:hypothetical protein